MTLQLVIYHGKGEGGSWSRRSEREETHMKCYTVTELGMSSGIRVDHSGQVPSILVGDSQDSIPLGRKDFPKGLRDEKFCSLGGRWVEFWELLSQEAQKAGECMPVVRRSEIVRSGKCPNCGAALIDSTPHAVYHEAIPDSLKIDGIDLLRRTDRDGWLAVKHPNPRDDKRCLVLINIAHGIFDIPEGAKRPETHIIGRGVSEVHEGTTKHHQIRLMVFTAGRECTVKRGRQFVGPESIRIYCDKDGLHIESVFARDPDAPGIPTHPVPAVPTQTQDKMLNKLSGRHSAKKEA